MWLQRQKRWVLLEQEHQEKVRQWDTEEVAREQRQRLGQPERTRGEPQREPEWPKEGPERMVFLTASRWRDLQKAAVAPPPSWVQSAHQGRRPSLSWSPSTQQPASRNQRIMSSAKFTQKPCTCWVPMKFKKSASFPVTGSSLRKVTQPPLHISLVTVPGKVYHMDVEALRKNLQFLSEEAGLGLPYYLRSNALDLITSMMALNTLRLPCLCYKYILYRRFWSLQ